jgi:hypothetical protein
VITRSASPASAGQGAPRSPARRAAPILLAAALYALALGLLLDVALKVW